MLVARLFDAPLEGPDLNGAINQVVSMAARRRSACASADDVVANGRSNARTRASDTLPCERVTFVSVLRATSFPVVARCAPVSLSVASASAYLPAIGTTCTAWSHGASSRSRDAREVEAGLAEFRRAASAVSPRRDAASPCRPHEHPLHVRPDGNRRVPYALVAASRQPPATTPNAATTVARTDASRRRSQCRQRQDGQCEERNERSRSYEVRALQSKRRLTDTQTDDTAEDWIVLAEDDRTGCEDKAHER